MIGAHVVRGRASKRRDTNVDDERSLMMEFATEQVPAGPIQHGFDPYIENGGSILGLFLS